MGNTNVKGKPEIPKHAPIKVAHKTGRFEPIYKTPVVFPKKQCLLRLLKNSRILDYYTMEEEFIKRNAKKPMRAIKRNEEKIIRKLRGSPITLGRVHELFEDEKHAVVVVEGSKREWYVPILSIVDRNQIRIGSLVLLNVRGMLKSVPKAIVGVLSDEFDQSSQVHKIEKVPTENFQEIGGLDSQIQEIKESVELPLIHPEYFEEMGITAPKGVILYGEPGTGKTLLAKAVANSTSATFIRATGADLVQKNSGDGAKVVREIFRAAKLSAPAIIFIDEIDAVGTKRYESTCCGEREVQRTLLELLNQMDGFDTGGDVKIILATNRIDSLDPALIRPGRIDRKIELPNPDNEAKLKIFQIHSSRMSLSSDVDFQELIKNESTISGADIKAICSEAGLLALRAQRKVVCNKDFESATSKVVSMKKSNFREEFFM